jgi:circadian clock protein KaiC
MDSWLLLRNLECNGERNRGLYVFKSRGMAHSNQIREFLLTDHGVQLRDVYVGPSGLLTGSARVAQEARERAEAQVRKQEAQRKSFELKHKRNQLEAQIARMRAEFEIEEQGLLGGMHEMQLQEKQIVTDRLDMPRVRKADVSAAYGNGHA